MKDLDFQTGRVLDVEKSQRLLMHLNSSQLLRIKVVIKAELLKNFQQKYVFTENEVDALNPRVMTTPSCVTDLSPISASWPPCAGRRC